MSVGGTCGPFYSRRFERSDRPRGCHPGLSVTSPREEGRNMDDATPPGSSGPPMRGRVSRRSCEPVLRWLCRHGTKDQPDISLIRRRIRCGHEEHKRLGSTTSPPTGNTLNLAWRGSFGPRQSIISSGVLSANHGRPPTTVQGRPCCVAFVKTVSHFVLASLNDSTYRAGYTSPFRLLRPSRKLS
jgi:hypothetical protein